MNKKAIKFILLIIVLAVCWYLGRVLKIDASYYQELFSKYPLALSGAIFVLLYVGTTTFIWFGPKDVLRITSAIFFGAYVSTVFVWIGEMINAIVMFHLSRFLGRDYVQQKFHVKPEELNKMKDDASVLGVVAWRINPLIPFRMMDLGYGLTKIKFRKYFLAIIVFTFARILWLQFILAGIGTSLLDDAAAIINYFMNNPIVIRYSAVYFFIVIIVSIAAVMKRSARKRKKHEPTQ